ncbi:MAG: hypothetical protein FWC61_02325 [Proteobacteria bacterium]|nr:hypothetical protein [Pseudomonadota bacterium]
MNKNIAFLSLAAAAMCCAHAAHAIVIRNASGTPPSYAAAYSQVANMQAPAAAQNQQYVGATPAMVGVIPAAAGAVPANFANPGIPGSDAIGAMPAASENQISCNMVLPTGVMVPDRPNAGLRTGQAGNCSAVIEMRQLYGEKDVVLATAIVAAGDSIICNISAFPRSGYTEDAGKITFPADREPTMDDVVKVMNAEQKQNAALKIAGAAIVGALGGNALLGKSDNGQLFGTSKSKMEGTAIGAATGTALMLGNLYTGKVAGDTILSAGVNAAAGAAIGNMMAVGNPVLQIESCGAEKCLWGTVKTYKDDTYTYTDPSGATQTRLAFYDWSADKTMLCDNNRNACKQINIINFVFSSNKQTVDQARKDNFAKVKAGSEKFCLDSDGTMKNYCGDKELTWVPIESGGEERQSVPAMIVFPEKLFGSTYNDFVTFRGKNPAWPIFRRNNDGSKSEEKPMTNDKGEQYTLANFVPAQRAADEGGIIDLNNKARLKATAIGAGAGGALGGFSGYQGAQKDIEDRWVSAVRDYKDSLQKIYCASGTRFLGYYNDIIIIPSVKK